jgi:hypothetical protein
MVITNPIRKKFAKEFRKQGIQDIREDIQERKASEKDIKRRLEYIRKVHKQMMEKD